MGRKNGKQTFRATRLAGPWLLAWLLAASCAPGYGPSPHLVPAPPPEDGKPYRLLLYGGPGPEDFEVMAVMDREDDRFRIVSYTGEIDVKVREGLTAAGAFKEAVGFLGWQNSFRAVETRAITMPDGHVLGYELRPLYWLAGASDDAIDTDYVLGPDETVIFYVFLKRRFWPYSRDDIGVGGSAIIK